MDWRGFWYSAKIFHCSAHPSPQLWKNIGFEIKPDLISSRHPSTRQPHWSCKPLPIPRSRFRLDGCCDNHAVVTDPLRPAQRPGAEMRVGCAWFQSGWRWLYLWVAACVPHLVAPWPSTASPFTMLIFGRPSSHPSIHLATCKKLLCFVVNKIKLRERTRPSAATGRFSNRNVLRNISRFIAT